MLVDKKFIKFDDIKKMISPMMIETMLNDNDFNIFIDGEHFIQLLPFILAYSKKRDEILASKPSNVNSTADCQAYYGVSSCDECPNHDLSEQAEMEMLDILQRCISSNFRAFPIIDGKIERLLKESEDASNEHSTTKQTRKTVQ